MKFALLLYERHRRGELGADDRTRLFAEHVSFLAKLDASGALRGAQQLAPPMSATTVRHTRDQVTVHPGGHLADGEYLGGFYLVDAADTAEAIEFASALPSYTVEVRPLHEPDTP